MRICKWFLWDENFVDDVMRRRAFALPKAIWNAKLQFWCSNRFNLTGAFYTKAVCVGVTVYSLMRILILDTNYPGFTGQFWGAHPELLSSTYDQAWRALMDECFGTADFYSFNLRALGHEAHEVVVNDERLQRLWAREVGLQLPRESNNWHLTRRRKVIPWICRGDSQKWVYKVLRAQIEAFKPDVLYVQDLHFVSSDFLREMKPRVRLIAGQTGSALQHPDLSVYDVIFTLFPHYVEKIQRLGIRARYFRLGFEPRVLEKVQNRAPICEAAFVGGLSSAHLRRTRFLEEVFARVPFDLWGYGAQTLEADSPLRGRHHGEIWGAAMFETLRRARVALNIHSDEAGEFACNMRLYEATGMATALLTDTKRNLSEFFDPQSEVVAYENAEDCAQKLRFLLENDALRERIAVAGQKRTLKQHTYAQRMEELVAMLEEECNLAR